VRGRNFAPHREGDEASAEVRDRYLFNSPKTTLHRVKVGVRGLSFRVRLRVRARELELGLRLGELKFGEMKRNPRGPEARRSESWGCRALQRVHLPHLGDLGK